MNSKVIKTIGVVGGMGPFAGLDLLAKIFSQTKANCDQHHLPVCMLSTPHLIPDRTEFLQGLSATNPGYAIGKIISTLHRSGARVVGIPCNTAHIDAIFSAIRETMPIDIKLLHMVDEVARHLQQRNPRLRKIGILSTSGTHQANIYPDFLGRYGMTGIQVTESIQAKFIQPAINDPEYGIKACSRPISRMAIDGLLKGIDFLIDRKVEAIILGCTEIPLAMESDEIAGIPLIDATMILARSLILQAAPDSLAEPIL